MVTEEAPELPSSHRHAEYTATYGAIPSARDRSSRKILICFIFGKPQIWVIYCNLGKCLNQPSQWGKNTSKVTKLFPKSKDKK